MVRYKMTVIPSQEIVKIEKQGKANVFSSKTTAKDFRSWIEHKIGVFSKTNNEEYRQVFMEILKAYNYYEPKQVVQVNANQWKGKSSVDIIKGLDRLIVIKYQKETEESEPTEIRTEVSKEEIQAMIDSILKFKIGDEIETENLSMVFSQTLNLGHDGWNTGNKQFFSDRHWHNKYTIILNAFQQLGFIEYKAGRTKLIDKKISLQLILE
jgi:hypothetical protein